MTSMGRLEARARLLHVHHQIAPHHPDLVMSKRWVEYYNLVKAGVDTSSKISLKLGISVNNASSTLARMCKANWFWRSLSWQESGGEEWIYFIRIKPS